MNVLFTLFLCILVSLMPQVFSFSANIVHSISQLNSQRNQRGHLFHSGMPGAFSSKACQDVSRKPLEVRQQSTKLQAFIDVKILIGLGALLVAGSALVSSRKDDVSEIEEINLESHSEVIPDDPRIQNEQEALKKALAEEAEKLKEQEMAKDIEERRVKEAALQAQKAAAIEKKLLDELSERKRKEEVELQAKRAEEERERIRLQKEKQMEIERVEREQAELKAKEEEKVKAEKVAADKLKQAQKEAEEANMLAYKKKLEKAKEEAKAKTAAITNEAKAKTVAESGARVKIIAAEEDVKNAAAEAKAKDASTSDRAKVRDSKKKSSESSYKPFKKELNNTYENFFVEMTMSASKVQGTNAKKIDDVIALYAKCPLPKLRSILDKYCKEGVEKPDKDATVDLLVRAAMASVWYSTGEWTSFLKTSEQELAEQARETTLYMRGAITAGNELSESRIKQLIREVGGPKAMPRKKRGSEVKLSKSDYLAALLEILKTDNENDFQKVAEALQREAGKKGLSKSTKGKATKSTSSLASDKKGFGAK